MWVHRMPVKVFSSALKCCIYTKQNEPHFQMADLYCAICIKWLQRSKEMFAFVFVNRTLVQCYQQRATRRGPTSINDFRIDILCKKAIGHCLPKDLPLS